MSRVGGAARRAGEGAWRRPAPGEGAFRRPAPGERACRPRPTPGEPAPVGGRSASRRGRGAALAAGAAPLLLLLFAACAETVRPVLGGLKIGVHGGAFTLPVMTNERAPFEYPPDAWRSRVGGETVLKIYISTRGMIDSAFVLQSSGHASLDSAALANARKLRYRPARQGEEPVAVWATLPIRYPLPEEIAPDE